MLAPGARLGREVLLRIGVLIGVGAMAQAPDAGSLVGKLDAYLLDYQSKLSAVVAIEVMTQQLDSVEVGAGNRRSFQAGTKRTIESEVSFGSLPGETAWLGFRRVRLVNGKAIGAASPSTDELLRSGDHREVANALLEQGARHNLGAFRNTNLPNLPLELLHPRHRDRFDVAVAGTARIDGTPATILVAREREVPSIIRVPDGRDLNSTVTAWVDAAGRLLQAEVRARMAAGGWQQEEPIVRVKFRINAQLGLLVPVEMRETFWSDAEDRRGTGVARYRGFRRFETGARIVPPPGLK